MKQIPIKELSILWCDGAKIDLTTLSDIRSIRYLEIFRVSKLDDISFVNKLTGLEKLELVWLPHITKLPDLSSLYQLEEVKIDSLNGLTDISALINVENLKKVKMLNVKKYDKRIHICCS